MHAPTDIHNVSLQARAGPHQTGAGASGTLLLPRIRAERRIGAQPRRRLAKTVRLRHLPESKFHGSRDSQQLDGFRAAQNHHYIRFTAIQFHHSCTTCVPRSRTSSSYLVLSFSLQQLLNMCALSQAAHQRLLVLKSNEYRKRVCHEQAVAVFGYFH